MNRNEQPKQLSIAQKRAIAALLTERDVRSAAQMAGVGESTLRRWLREDTTFVTELRREERELLDASTRLLLRGQQAAVATLLGVMADKNASASLRMRAATIVLDMAAKRLAGADLEVRIMELEELAGLV